MKPEEIEKLIDSKIRSHEIRVGWISGIIGIFFVFGIVHSIWLMKNLIS
jgi:hypothetical protein